MRREIWKWPLENTDVQVLMMQYGAEILSVQSQYGIPFLWALVYPQAGLSERRIRIYGIGHQVDEAGKFIGTYQLSGGALVFHVFDCGEPKPEDAQE